MAKACRYIGIADRNTSAHAGAAVRAGGFEARCTAVIGQERGESTLAELGFKRFSEQSAEGLSKHTTRQAHFAYGSRQCSLESACGTQARRCCWW